MEKTIDYKLIFSDLDETLLVDHHVPDINKKAIDSLKNTKFIVATGRPYETAYPILKELGTYDKEDEYCICMNGGLIIENKDRRILRVRGLDFDTAKKIFDYGKNLDVCVMICTIDDIYLFHASKEEIDRKKNQKARFTVADDYDMDFLCDQTIIKILYQKEDFNYLLNISKDMDPAILSSVQLSYSSYRYIEFNALNVYKGEAMLFLADYLGVSKEEVIAIGDNYNDESMVKMAGLGVCVNDGIIKDSADYVCENGYRDGAVKEVIDKFVGDRYEF